VRALSRRDEIASNAALAGRLSKSIAETISKNYYLCIHKTLKNK
jgi:hypothetical protein